jgi:Cytochrome b/b6/petB
MPAGKQNRWEPVAAWLNERLALDSIRQFLDHKKVPVHSGTIWYTFGGITLFLFVIQVITGILLLVYYRPTPQDAFESVQFIMTRVSYGWLIRSIHSWSANLMILSAFIHMFSVVFLIPKNTGRDSDRVNQRVVFSEAVERLPERERRLTHLTCGEQSPRLSSESANRRKFLLDMAIFAVARARAVGARVSTTGDQLLVEKRFGSSGRTRTFDPSVNSGVGQAAWAFRLPKTSRSCLLAEHGGIGLWWL